MAEVLILLATYNGSIYVDDMINSIIEQDYVDWRLVLSDDGSSDNTIRILEAYADKYPNRITHYRSGQRFGNAAGHFMHLLQQFHDEPYIMFCDQDDIWHSDKITKTLDKMRQIENDINCPALVHTDLRVVDRDLNVLDDSFMHYSGLDGTRVSLKELLVQNVVTGCTMMINHSLAELACEHMPTCNMQMHDWWLALIAAACGTIGFLDECTIDYRQHGGNSVGAKNSKSLSYICSRLRSGAASMDATFRQADAFYQCFSLVIGEEMESLVKIYVSLSTANHLTRKYAYIKYGFLKNGRGRVLGQLLLG